MNASGESRCAIVSGRTSSGSQARAQRPSAASRRAAFSVRKQAPDVPRRIFQRGLYAVPAIEDDGCVGRTARAGLPRGQRAVSLRAFVLRVQRLLSPPALPALCGCMENLNMQGLGLSLNAASENLVQQQ